MHTNDSAPSNDNTQNHKSGDITGIEVWCEDCNCPHPITPEQLVLIAAKFPDHPLVGKVGEGLVNISLAMLLASGKYSPARAFKPSDTMGIVTPYSAKDMDKLINSDLFRNFHP